jgi:hypothetical protein
MGGLASNGLQIIWFEDGERLHSTVTRDLAAQLALSLSLITPNKLIDTVYARRTVPISP